MPVAKDAPATMATAATASVFGIFIGTPSVEVGEFGTRV
jgi:hypothetical protein